MPVNSTASSSAPTAKTELTLSQLDTIHAGASITAGAIYSALTVASAGLGVAIALIRAV